MGLPVSIEMRDEGMSAAVAAAMRWLYEVDTRFSPFRPESEVCRFDRGELTDQQVSRELGEILALCTRYEWRTGGAFRARLPTLGVDPRAVVQGWAVQRAATMLRCAGATRFRVDVGGDAVAAGEPEPGGSWRIGLRHPDAADQVCAVARIRDAAVATSGGMPVRDGRTGLPARGLLSVTVVAGDLTTADATAAAALAMGAEGARWAAAEPGCEVLAVDENRQVHTTSGFPLT
jgi:thiamine biosynthesis lipoprotein